MTTIEGSNPLADLAARIVAEHEACKDAVKRGAEHVMRAGDLLIEAKALLQHGQWLPWLAKHCAFSDRTAQLYMRLAKRRPEIEANPQRVADLSLRGAVAMLAPDEADKALAGGREIVDRVREVAARLGDAVEITMRDLHEFAAAFNALSRNERDALLAKLDPQDVSLIRRCWRRWLAFDDEVIHEARTETMMRALY
jgi:hypothetical protein